MRIAVVDGYSTGRLLVEALRRHGAECVHVRSAPDTSAYFTRGFRADDYLREVVHAGDPAATAAALSGLDIARVVAGTESGVLLADALADLLGLPGNRPELLAARRDKRLMAAAADAAGLAVPLGRAFDDPDAAARWCAGTGPAEAVVKPPSSAGSDQVRFCTGPEEVRRAAAAVLATRDLYGAVNEQVLVQERLRGTEYYVNTVSHRGVHRVAELWRYTKRVGPAGTPVYDYEEPVAPDADEAAPVREFALRVLDALGVESGAAHTEVMVTARGPVLIESGARLGGGTLPWVSEKYSGVSQTSLLTESLLDPGRLSRFDDTATAWSGTVRNVALINPAAGPAAPLDWTARIEALPTAVALVHGVTPGAPLPATTDLINSPGFVYLASNDPAEVERDYRHLRAMERAGLYCG
ncbi:ATP-grasp domain-containing protein [Kitasatospora cineracea]|uniref:ATP-grasp domain-containing protein n=1 Tax=Kitasatospora cineracea TaxID=88074 RepID=UPI00342D7FB3